MEFTPDDYKRMMFNVYEHPTDIIKAFPDLRVYKEFEASTGELNKDKVLAYIFYVYDKYSPYRIKYKDLFQRKAIVVRDIGYGVDADTKKYPDVIEDLIQGKLPKVNDMIIAFSKMHNSISYSHLVMLETLYYSKLKYVFQGTQEKIKELQDIKKAYEEAEQEVLMQDQTKGLTKSLYLMINSDSVALSPEDIAKEIKTKGVSKLNDRLLDEDDF